MGTGGGGNATATVAMMGTTPYGSQARGDVPHTWSMATPTAPDLPDAPSRRDLDVPYPYPHPGLSGEETSRATLDPTFTATATSSLVDVVGRPPRNHLPQTVVGSTFRVSTEGEAERRSEGGSFSARRDPNRRPTLQDLAEPSFHE